MKRITKYSAAAIAAALLGVGASTSRATVIQQDSSSSVGGWTITTPSGVGLIASVNDGVLDIAKSANFTSSSPALITFDQSNADAVSTIAFTNESITNNSGSKWSEFSFIILNESAATAKFGSVSQVFLPPTPAFSKVSVAKEEVDYTGGSGQASGSTVNWGNGSTDELLISADPTGSTDFQFAESPTSGGGGGGGTVVPLPAAVWQTLTGLLGLGLLAAGKKVRSIIA